MGEGIKKKVYMLCEQCGDNNLKGLPPHPYCTEGGGGGGGLGLG